MSSITAGFPVENLSGRAGMLKIVLMNEEQLQKYIFSHEWHIDSMYGIRSLTSLMLNIQMASEGVDSKDLGFAEQRKLSQTIALLNPESGRETKRAYSVKEVPSDSEYIARMDYSGVMRMEDGMCSMGIKNFGDQLYNVSKLSNVTGIMVYMDTGGGVSTAGNFLHNIVANIDKPVAFVTPFLGSAGYNAAAPADLIIAMGETAEVGSIGSFITINKTFWSWYEENFEDVYSSLSPDKNEVVRAIKSNDREKLVEYLDDHTIDFHGNVKKYRNLGRSSESTLRGGMFKANSARSRGLIDGIGGYDYTLRRLKSQIKYQS